jgi:hypothetical protein
MRQFRFSRGQGWAVRPTWEGGIMKLMAVTSAVLLVLAVQGCSAPDSDACYGLSDAEALNTVVRAYESKRPEPDMKFSKERLLGVARSGEPRSDGDSVIELWFLQDDKSVTVANIYQDCELKFTKASVDNMKYNAYPVKPPKL